jgi:RNA polymerase sigma-70 factor (ECF subfamily)
LKLSVRLRAYYRNRLGAGCSDAEDLVQETLIAIHARRATFDRARLFTPWAYAMARSKLVDYLRRSRVRAAVSMDDCEEFFAMDETEQGRGLARCGFPSVPIAECHERGYSPYAN